ncbi:helix-turn-helix domain-containing protein [Crateriforma conspicua]|uniref:HTH-type transcriptional regulator YesS n=1 Tax=Crateriforma conspicua TaxID=2527996 RepID=A0A5C5Y9T5_9PLAN|nr:AraC family transcriptional regulator [Crateriforma conspicua]TWT72456.1 HTH-type transcriptional regulator YesS [Crateriforma conspicua]
MSDRRTSRPVDEVLPDFGVFVFESHHTGDFSMDFRSHRFVKLIYVLEGAGKLETQTITKPFQSGDVIVVPPELRHRVVDAPEQPSRLYVACISLNLLRFDSAIAKRFAFFVLGDPHLTTRVAVTMRRMVYRQQTLDDSISLSMVADALRLLESVLDPRTHVRKRVARGMTRDQESMRRYVSYLEDYFFEATTIDEAAASLGMSRRHFTKLFSQQTGTTWLNFVRGKAVDHAKKRLQDTSIPIASVAFECGFNDLTTFYRQFKKHAGMSPAKYRQQSDQAEDSDR